MIIPLEAFREDLETALSDSDPVCEVDRITVTAGEPAAPSGNCRAVWIWASQVEDAAQFDAECLIRSRLTISYRIDVCYQEGAEDLTDEEHAEAADCLYYLMDRVWCGIVAGKDAGDLAGSESCDRITIEALRIDPRQGGIVSATGSVVVDYHC